MSRSQPETIAVTGASRGIGEAIVRRLARRGHHLILLARTRNALEDICQDITRNGGTATFIEADLCTPEAARVAAHRLKEACEHIDALVVNAGVSNNLLFEETSLERIDYELGVNYLAPLTLIHELLPGMLERKRGKIVAVGSLTAVVPFPGNATYAASKAALVTALRNLRIELSDRGIQVGAVLPGLTRTQLSHGMATLLPALEPEQVAEAVEQCLEKDTGFVVPGLDNRLAAAVSRFFPFSLDRYLGSVARYLVPGYEEALRRRAPL